MHISAERLKRYLERLSKEELVDLYLDIATRIDKEMSHAMMYETHVALDRVKRELLIVTAEHQPSNREENNV